MLRDATTQDAPADPPSRGRMRKEAVDELSVGFENRVRKAVQEVTGRR